MTQSQNLGNKITSARLKWQWKLEVLGQAQQLHKLSYSQFIITNNVALDPGRL